LSTRRVEPIWGTIISLYVLDPVDPVVIDDVFGWFQRVDALFSTWRADTEISRIGCGELALGDASPEVREVLARCEQMKHKPFGAFDISVGPHAHGDPRPRSHH